jgi:sec-independent protein translocase protein TatA
MPANLSVPAGGALEPHMTHAECALIAGLPLATLNGWHIAVLVALILLLFGGKKLPELARGLARGMRIFRDELHGVSKDVQETLDEPADSGEQKQKKAESNPYSKDDQKA